MKKGKEFANSKVWTSDATKQLYSTEDWSLPVPGQLWFMHAALHGLLCGICWLKLGWVAASEKHYLLQVKKAGKLLPNNPKILNEIGPSRAGRLSNVRNVPRQGGFGAGQPYQKPKAGIPSKPF